MKNLNIAILLGLSVLVLSACNTTRGLGQDLEATGEKIEEVAEDTKDKLSGE
ncbi:MAG: entericidin A/B family lipoprotein [Gammaproteobacteria bacterium]|nr:entericidin A/B family lipoprotein [Gammaproteobacteria bacterium]